MAINNSHELLNSVFKVVNFSFAENTTYGLGGLAKAAYFPDSREKLEIVFNYLKGSGEELCVLGNGSDILASDGGFDGNVICTKHLKGIHITAENTVYCQAGTTVSALLKFCSDNGLSGLEYLAGIPATMGGIAFMNAGAAGKYICDSVVKVDFFDGKSRSFLNNQCNFGYKYSIMRDIIGVISGIELQVSPQNPEIVRENIAQVLKSRSWHPKGKSCGCVFKNPAGLSAGKLIDECGLKGFTVGGAVVSDKHANFVLNRGGSSADVRKVIDTIKSRVFESKGIVLEEEVVYIGDF